jgi:hypothetical protein
MSSIVIGKSGQVNVSIDIPKLVPTRLLVVANSGQGKTWALRRCAEQFHGKIPVWIIDPEGEFYTLREKFDYLLVGEGGEVPADCRIAGKLVETLLETRASVIFDLFETFRTKPSERHHYVRVVLEAMLNAPRRLWHPTVVILDEAHTFVPEKGESEAAEAAKGLCTAGRKRGFVAVLASQRLAALDKNASALCMNRLVGGTFEDVDVDRAVDMLSVSREDKFQFKKDLKVLEPGTFFALGRAISKDRILFKVGLVETTHPEAGKIGKLEPPPPSDKIKAMLPTLADLPQIAEQEARTLAEFKAQVRTLRAQLRSQPVKVETKVVTQGDPQAVDRAINQTTSLYCKAIKERDELFSKIGRGLAELAKQVDNRPRPVNPFPSYLVKILAQPKPLLKPVDPPPPVHLRVVDEQNPGLTAAQERILVALAQLVTIGQTTPERAMVAFWSEAPPTSGGFKNNLGALRTAGHIDYPQPGTVRLTESGRALAGEQQEPTTEEVFQRGLQLLTKAQQEILKVVRDVYPQSISREDLAERAGVPVTSGGFKNNLGAMRTAGLLDYPATGTVRCAEWLCL